MQAGSPKCTAGARDDGELLHLGGAGDERSYGSGQQRVAGLMARHNALLHALQDAALLLNAGHAPQHSGVKVCRPDIACGNPTETQPCKFWQCGVVFLGL
jgi:hypothetical protein